MFYALFEWVPGTFLQKKRKKRIDFEKQKRWFVCEYFKIFSSDFIQSCCDIFGVFCRRG